MNLKLFSGGQTGVDQAALDIAIELGIPCGGSTARRCLLVLLLGFSLIRTAECRTNDFRQSNKPYVYAGLPQSHYTLTILTNTSYLVGYDEGLKAPRWVAYRLFKIGEPWQAAVAPARKGMTFSTDKRTQAKVSDGDCDGIGTGLPWDKAKYDRGHMAPNAGIATRYGLKGQRETFTMSNVLIQEHVVNDGAWGGLEDLEARGYANTYTNVWVICGPIFASTPPRYDKNGQNAPGIAVPKGFFKIHIVEKRGRPEIQAVEMSQQLKDTKLNLATVQTTVRQIEQDTGLEFLKGLPAALQTAWETNKVVIALPPTPSRQARSAVTHR